MRILCLTTFLDGTDRFEKDDTRTVDDDRGAYFIANGWAQDTAGAGPAAIAPASPSNTLDIQSGLLGVGDSNG